MPDRVPAEIFPPGEYIKDELAERGWTQADLAEILGRSVAAVSEIVNGRRGVTPETAKGLAEAFGTSAEVWLNLEARYRLHHTSSVPGTELRSRIYTKAPVREMIKRGWIEGSGNPEVLSLRVCEFLNISSLDEDPKPFAHAARKATSYSESSPSQIAWLCRVGQLAPAAPLTGTFRRERVPELIAKLRDLSLNVPDSRRVPKLLSDYGIRFLIVEVLPGSKIDGVAFWMNQASPVIALSLRYGRMNNFWHTLLHEISHVINGDGRAEAFVDIDVELDANDLPPNEVEANRFAVETLIPADTLEDFINRVGPTYSLRRIQGFASRIGVHPSIVIGQLAHRSEIAWARFGGHLPNIREYVTSTALTDGFGHVLPAEI